MRHEHIASYWRYISQAYYFGDIIEPDVPPISAPICNSPEYNPRIRFPSVTIGVRILPSAVEGRLKLHLEEVKIQHGKDLKGGAGYVTLLEGLDRKYPNANR
jgi:hypothetical protein